MEKVVLRGAYFKLTLTNTVNTSIHPKTYFYNILCILE